MKRNEKSFAEQVKARQAHLEFEKFYAEWSLEQNPVLRDLERILEETPAIDGPVAA